MSNMTEESQPLTIEEARAFLKLAPGTFKRLCHLGEIPYIKVGRQRLFHKSDLVAWFESQRKAG